MTPSLAYALAALFGGLVLHSLVVDAPWAGRRAAGHFARLSEDGRRARVRRSRNYFELLLAPIFGVQAAIQVWLLTEGAARTVLLGGLVVAGTAATVVAVRARARVRALVGPQEWRGTQTRRDPREQSATRRRRRWQWGTTATGLLVVFAVGLTWSLRTGSALATVTWAVALAGAVFAVLAASWATVWVYGDEEPA